MTPRERTLVIALLAAVTLAAGAFLFHQFYLVPLGDRQDKIRTTQEQNIKDKARINEVLGRQAKMDEWRKLSLPPDVASSQAKYDQLLRKLITDSGIPTGGLEVTPSTATNFVARGPDLPRGAPSANREPFITPLTFTVSGQTDLPHLVKLLKEFYSTPLLHRIKFLKVERPRVSAASGPKAGELQINLLVEAIIVHGADQREELVRAGSAASRNPAETARDYTAMDDRNIFYGLPAAALKMDEGPDPAKSIELTSITRTLDGRMQVTLCERPDSANTANIARWYLYPDDKGPDRFVIKNKIGGVRLEGEVIRVEGLDVVFRAGEKHYSMHLGDTLEDALRKPLKGAQVGALIPTRAPVNNGAQ